MEQPPPYQGYGHPQPPGYPPQQPGYPPQQPGYPPQQPGYAPPPSSGYPQPTMATNTTTVIATQPTQVVSVPVVFSEYPVSMMCPLCRAQIVTAVTYETGSLAYLLFFLMCIFGFWLCCFIPFCIDSCKDATHSCPNCRAQLGVCRRM